MQKKRSVPPPPVSWSGLGSEDPLERLKAAEAVITWAQAQQFDALGEVSQKLPAMIDPTGHLLDPAPAEVSAAMRWSTGAARERLDLSEWLDSDYSMLHQALSDGLVDLAKTRTIIAQTANLNGPVRDRLVADAIRYAPDHTRAQLTQWLRQGVLAADPAAAGTRRRRAKRDRSVWIISEDDGMAIVSAYLPADAAQHCLNALTVPGDPDDPRTVNQRRADLFVTRITGLDPETPAPTQVLVTIAATALAGMDDKPGWLAGYGPITAGYARELACGDATWRRVLLDPDTGSVVNISSSGYRPGAGLRRLVRARDRHCRFPGCRRPAVHCDIDHTAPWPHGDTCSENLGLLCRYHHRLKTMDIWHLSRDRKAAIT